MPLEILHWEESRAALGGGGDNLGRLRFQEAFAAELTVCAAGDGGANLEVRRYLGSPQVHVARVEPRLQFRIHAVGNPQRQRRGGAAQYFEPLGDQLQPAGGFGVDLHRAVGQHHRLARHRGPRLVILRADLALGERELHLAGAVAQRQEGDAAEVARLLQPAGEGLGGAVVVGREMSTASCE